MAEWRISLRWRTTEEGLEDHKLAWASFNKEPKVD